MTVADLLYSFIVTPLTLAVFMTGNRFATDAMEDGRLTSAIIQVCLESLIFNLTCAPAC